MLRQVVVGALILTSVTPALAQVPPAPAPEPAPVAEPEALVEPRGDDAWTIYHDAFAALSGGDEGKARALTARLLSEHAAHPAALRAAAVLAALDAPPSTTIAAAVDRPARGKPVEHPTSGARAELALFQTIHGIAIGSELCAMAGCDEAGAFVGLALLGGALGAGVSLAAIKDVTPGKRALLNSGTIWGAANAGVLLAVTEPDSASAIAGGMIAGQVGGMLVGAALDRSAPTAGQVALANTVGIWTAAIAGSFMAAADADFGDTTTLGMLMLGTDVGLVLGAGLATRHPEVPRGRTLVIDAGGIVGGLFGVGATLMASDDPSEQTVAGVAGAGALIGLALATYFTRGWLAD